MRIGNICFHFVSSSFDTAELIGLEEFPLCFTPLSMESQADYTRDPESDAEEGGICASCGQLLSLAGPYCPCCGDRGKGWGVHSDPAPQADEDEDEAMQGGGEEGGDGPPKLNSCKLCSFSSRYSNHLKRHMKTHNGEKLYRCRLCACASAQLVNLQRHLRIHTGEKPYSCAHCHFSCSSLGNLKRHQCMHVQEQRSHCSTSLHRHATAQTAAEEPDESARDTAELIGLEEFPLCFTPLSMESQADYTRDPESDAEEGGICASCGQLLSLAGPYCPCCGDRGKGWGVHSDPAPQADEDEDEAMQGGGEEGGDGPPKLNSCKLCSFSSRYSNHLKRHMKTHNGEKPYRCPLCAYASAQLVNLQRHLRIHTGEKPYSCAHCHFSCSSLGNLKRHQCMHVQEQRSHCSTSLHRHVIAQTAAEEPDESAREAVQRSHHHDNQLNPGNDLPQDGSGAGGGARVVGVANAPPELLFPFSCRLCGVVLEDEDGTSAQICSSCTLDMLTKAPAGSAGERGDRVYSCALCPFTTQYPNHLARHMKTHSGEKPYKCPQCEYASAHFDNLKRHHRVHTGEKPYKCHLCDYACGNLANLKRHQRIHSGTKPFQCAVCSYSCNQSMNLKRHMLRHTGEKPFCCQECPYTTGHWDNYKRHQRKHGHSAHGWVKVQLPHTEEEDEEEEEETEEEEID